MPVLPVIAPIRGIGAGVEFSRVSGAEMGGQLGQAIGGFGELLQQAQNEQDSIAAKTQAVLLDAHLEDLKTEVQAEPDYAKREQLYQQKSAEYLRTQTDSIDSPRVKQALNAYYSFKFPREAVKFRAENMKQWGQERVAQTESLGDMMIRQSVTTADPMERAKYKSLYMSQLDQLTTGPYAPLNPLKRREMADQYDTKFNMAMGLKDATDNPGEMLSRPDNDPRFGNLQ